MATTTSKPTPTNDQPTTPVDDLETLRAEAKRINDAIKAARAALPKFTPLERVINQQAEHPQALITLQRIKARIRAGQPEADAIEAVFAADRAWVREQLGTTTKMSADTD